jgi:hypothetical protein
MPEMARGKISVERDIHYCPKVFSFSRRSSLYCEEYACVNTHISDCVDIVYGLTINIVSETFLHKSGEVQSVEWMFITGVPAW